MGLKESSNNSSTNSLNYNLVYNSTIGVLLINDDATNAALASIVAEIGGKDEMKKGYSNVPGSTTAIVKKKLAEAGVKTYESISGKLVSAYIKPEKTPNGDVYHYLKIHAKATDPTTGVVSHFRLSMPDTNTAAQMIARKVMNAEPGQEITVAPFPTFDKKEGKDRAYAEHGASVKSNGEEIPVGYVAEFHEARVGTREKMAAMGISSESINKEVDGKVIALVRKAMEETSARFKAYYDARATTQDAPAAEKAASVPEMADPDARSTPAASADMNEEVKF